MKALLLTAPSRLEMVDHPTPVPAADEVQLRIRACGICGSDIHGWDGSSGRRQVPLIMGHEAAGEISQVGAAVTDWAVGDRVTFDSTVYCGTCPACRRGAVNLCTDRRVVGVSPGTYRQHGAFAEYLTVPARILYRLPASLSFEQAAFAEPVSIAQHALTRADISPTDSAVVIGSGMIGLLVIQSLRAAGVSRIIAVDREATRLDHARALGATETVEVTTGDPVATIHDYTDGHGADVVFEVVGIEPTVKLAIAAARLGGKVVLVGNLAPEVTFPLQHAVTRELTILGSCGSAGEYPASLELIASGAIQVEPMISAVVPLADGAAWFAKLSTPEGGAHLKVILQP
ncbi:zinc-dependent alcohol dehydrogenase [Synoicihabitans lomoniglobus]|uniref:Galactitol-1-phosphate 5-dehydrogenase n=1 Tax=Synoicihabitans lomoniglobus TaxID=2909285 RepID=A0AAF0CPL3_9BACT|nr:galactitol-1-phosphate 5-dehydrogenase [Opitutaceae bacterium LMO-M01]WED65344.1 galactitol-1-phosphate 5-dehydrogenase [Opitutaceae bacterium LMO-M01]